MNLTKNLKITSNNQYHTTLAMIETFIKKVFNNLTEIETEELKQASLVVEAYEKIKFKPLISIIFLFQLVLFACVNPTSKHPKDDPTISVESNDSSMNQAINLARKTLSKFKQALIRDTTAKQFSLKMKYPIPSGGNEHIWIDQVTIKDRQMSGVIDNSPNNIPSLQLGDTILVDEEKISDWLFKKSDSIHGGFTIRILRDRMNETERADLDRSLGYPFALE